MKPAAKSRKREAPVEPSRTPSAPMTLKIGLNITEDTPVYYANHFEVGHSNFEFMLNVARFPPKPSKEQMQSAAEEGALIIEPEFQILFAPKVALTLLEVLKAQIASYEAHLGPISTGS